MIITIGREYGSGGHFIAEKLAAKLGIPCYDKEIIQKAAKNSFFAEDFVKENEEKVTSFFDSVFNGSLSLTDNLYIQENNAINELAGDGDCIMVGRCADYVLRNRDDLIRIFIEASMEGKVARATEFYGVEKEKAEEKINKANKDRARYYNYFTDRKWGRSDNYDIIINSDIGIDETVEVLASYISYKKAKQAK